MMVTESYDENIDAKNKAEVVLHQHDKLYSESASDVRDRSIYVNEETVGGGQHDHTVSTGRSVGYSNKVATQPSTSTQRVPVVLSHLAPARHHHPNQLNERRRNHRRGFSADRGELLLL